MICRRCGKNGGFARWTNSVCTECQKDLLKEFREEILPHLLVEDPTKLLQYENQYGFQYLYSACTACGINTIIERASRFEPNAHYCSRLCSVKKNLGSGVCTKCGKETTSRNVAGFCPDCAGAISKVNAERITGSGPCNACGTWSDKRSLTGKCKECYAEETVASAKKRMGPGLCSACGVWADKRAADGMCGACRAAATKAIAEANKLSGNCARCGAWCDSRSSSGLCWPCLASLGFHHGTGSAWGMVDCPSHGTVKAYWDGSKPACWICCKEAFMSDPPKVQALEDAGMTPFPTFLATDAENWWGSREAFENALVESGIGWFAYVKCFVGPNGDPIPLAACKSGSRLVNATGSDVRFGYDDTGLSRAFLNETGSAWEQTFIYLKAFASEADALTFEQAIQESLKLFG